MTVQAQEGRTQLPPRPTLVRRLAEVLDDLAALVGGCVLEGSDGRVLGHRLPIGEPPDDVAAVVLTGDCTGLHRAASRPRTLCLLPTGPVLAFSPPRGGAALAQALLAGGASVWLLRDGDWPSDFSELADALQLLLEIVECTAEDAADVVPWLDGDAPVPVADARRPVRLARLDATEVSHRVLANAVTRGTPLRHRGALYVLLSGVDQLELSITQPFRAVISEPTTDVVRARRQIDAALPAVPDDGVWSLAEVRPIAVLRHFGASLATLPDLGDDPLDVLREHDRRRDGQLLLTLREWLAVGCDNVRAAESLHLHVNTLRYRVRRIIELLGADLRTDVTARLEIQLRLLTDQLTASGRSGPS